VTISVWDVAGRRVRSLAARSPLAAGPHSLAWDGRDESGTPVAPGVYLARVTAGALRAECRLVRIQ
jgi:alkaline phosphatase